jgi:hypothetical protein
MSTLVLALASGMAVGTGTEAISAEMDQPLDVRAKWEGSYDFGDRKCAVILADGLLGVERGGRSVASVPFQLEDEGHGKVRAWANGKCFLGVYKHEKGCLFICLGGPRNGRPTSFLVDECQSLFTLRRASGK